MKQQVIIERAHFPENLFGHSIFLTLFIYPIVYQGKKVFIEFCIHDFEMNENNVSIWIYSFREKKKFLKGPNLRFKGDFLFRITMKEPDYLRDEEHYYIDNVKIHLQRFLEEAFAFYEKECSEKQEAIIKEKIEEINFRRKVEEAESWDGIIGFDKEDYLKHLSKDVLKYKERSTGKIYEVNPNIDNEFLDTIYRVGFHTGEYILMSGELPDKWKYDDENANEEVGQEKPNTPDEPDT